MSVTGVVALEQAKAARNGARLAYETRLRQVREDLSARSVGGRIADHAAETAAQAADIARENKGIVAGTIAALGIWLLRGPIIAGIAAILADTEDDTPERNVDDE
jgi:hypothetical protein